MFQMERTRSSSSTASSNSASSSLSLSPAGWSPSRPSALLPTLSTDSESLNGARNAKTHTRRISASKLVTNPNSVRSGSFAYPNWPSRESLSYECASCSRPTSHPGHSCSPTSSRPHYIPGSSRISDDELEDLVFTTKDSTTHDASEAVVGISWSQVGGEAAAAAAAPEPQRRRRLPPPEFAMNATSSKRKGSKNRAGSKKALSMVKE